MANDTEKNLRITPNTSAPALDEVIEDDQSKGLETRGIAVNNPPKNQEINDVPGSKHVTPSESVSS